MKKIYFFIPFITSVLFISAQQPQWQWANRGGSPDQPNGFSGANQYADNVVVDTAGNSYVTGVVNSPSASFTNPAGATVTTYGELDIFLAKYDCSGNLLWVNILGSAGDDNPNGLQIGHDGMIYLYGYDGDGFFNVNTDSALSTFNASQASIFLAKFNASGVLEKIKIFDQSSTFNSPLQEYIQQRTDGDFIIGGGSNGGILVDSFNVQAGFFLARADTGLNVIWAKCEANATIVDAWPDFDRFVLDGNNNIFFAGAIENDSAIFGGQILYLTPGASSTAVVMKFDSAGNYLWYRKGTSPHYDGADFPTLDATGNLIVFVATQEGDTVLGFPLDYSGNSIYEPAFVKLNGNDGSLMYGIVANNNSTLSFSANLDLKYGYDHNLYLAYQLDGNVIFDSISLTAALGNAQALIWEFKDEDTAFRATNNYALLNSWAPPSDNQNAPYCFTYDQQGNGYICGTLSGSIYTPHDTISYANGGEQTDMFVAKFGLPCGDTNSLIPPLTPSDLVARATGPQAITVTWQNNALYVQRFRIYRSLDTVTWAVIDSVPASITTYIDVNVQPNVIYWYKASAVNNVEASQFTNSDSAEIIPQAIADMAQNNIQMLIQPNPNKGNFTLTLATDANASAQLTIYNVDGQQVLAQPVQIIPGNNWYPIQMPDAPAGVYIVQVSGENGEMGRGKFVKE